MGVFTFEDETTSPVAPAKLFKALVKDADEILPKAVDAIQSVETVEGNGGPGTIKKLTVNEGGKSNYVLNKIEAIDEANLVYNYSLVGGSEFPENVEKITFESKLVDGPNGGSIGKLKVKYHSKGNAEPNEAEVKEGKARGDALFKAIEGYVLNHPEYN
ncbi:class 10 plant pathogenesis-related protein 2A-like [Lotus japonicus]|uniref:Bet v I/Major latex protein domain-containing protein n=1 Tax=Lotus japonicus TaxID=34305 RepID=I3S306_LOTJA|nr:class 10 plant pathogenesis-related protein 2A-like [Lotus japonicus]AFK34648.1 unknown [Lotus japonicus]